MSNEILLYGKEHTFLDRNTEILYRNSNLNQTPALHTHTFYEVFLVVEGSAYHLINNTVQVLSKGDLVFIRPEDVHCYDFNYSENFRIYNLGFSTSIFSSLIQFLDIQMEAKYLCRLALPPTITLSPKALQTFIILLEELGNEEIKYERTDKENLQPTQIKDIQRLTKSTLSFIFHQFLKSSVTSTEGIVQSDIWSCKDWFSEVLSEMNKTENFCTGLSKMVSLAGCSKNHLCRICQKRLNCSPTEYINSKRLVYSTYLLNCTNDDILSISQNCGFNNVSHFYHLFKKKYGESPSRYRKSKTT